MGWRGWSGGRRPFKAWCSCPLQATEAVRGGLLLLKRLALLHHPLQALHPDRNAALGHPGVPCSDLPAGHAHRWVGGLRAEGWSRRCCCWHWHCWRCWRCAASPLWPPPHQSLCPLLTPATDRLPRCSDAHDMQHPAEAPLLVTTEAQEAEPRQQ